MAVDGSIWRTWTWTYDDDLVVLHSREHEPGASVLDWTRTRHLDPAGRWMLEELDRKSDGTIDQVHERSFHDGRLVSEDRFRDGKPLSQTTHTYLASGREETLVAWADGDSDLVVRSRDADRRLLTQSTDIGADGIWDDVRTTVWDPLGRTAWYEDWDGDGRPELTGWRENDGCGHREVEDLDGDLAPDRIRSYDCRGRLIQQALPHDRRTLRYSYSCP